MIGQDVLDQAEQRHRQRLRVAVVVVLVVPLVTATLVGLLGRMRGDGLDGRGFAILIAVELGVSVVTLALMLTLVRVLRRRGTLPAPLLGVDRRARRRILKAIRSGKHLSGLEEELALDSAQRQLRARRWGWVGPVFAAYYLIMWLTADDRDWFRTGLLVYIAAFGLALPFITALTARRARAYLDSAAAVDRQPEPGPTALR